MHKHVAKRNRGNSGWRNANHRLPESAARLLIDFPKVLECSSGSFETDYLRSEYLSKYCSPEPGEAALRRSRAIEKWLATESINAHTNLRWRHLPWEYNILPRVSLSRFLGFARKLVSEILGPLTDELVLGSFTGGASTSRNRTVSHPGYKYVGQADVTESARCFVGLIHHLSPLLREFQLFDSLYEVEGAKLFTVPKKSDIDRCACKEPDVNMFLQKGVGRHIRRRLLRFGINLNDQSINRSLAKRGSEDSSLSTLDLSAASDSICIEVVRALLPTDWFEYCNSIRSQSVEVEGTLIRTEMFSSMGNGFTFELESLIFFVLMRSVAYFEGISGIISIYGDDIIIPSGMSDMAVWVLTEFGFSTNPDKSFTEGPFRESCGGHYHYGVDVTPFYLKRKPTHLTDLIRVANQLRRWLLANEIRQYAYPEIVDFWMKLKAAVPSNLWGGRDTALDTQLVTKEPSRSRLVRINEEFSPPQLGLYLQWHVTNRSRSHEQDDSFSSGLPLNATKRCRLRRAKPGAMYPDLYLSKENES